jgi:hypothetical protein
MDESTVALEEWSRAAGATEPVLTPLDLAWPRGEKVPLRLSFVPYRTSGKRLTLRYQRSPGLSALFAAS